MATLDVIFDEAQARPHRLAVVFDGVAMDYRTFARCIAVTREWLAGRIDAAEGPAVISVWGLLEAWIIDLALRSLGADTVTVRTASDIADLGLPAASGIVTAGSGAQAVLSAQAEVLGCPLLVAPATIGAQAREPGPIPTFAPEDRRGGHILLTSGTTGVFKKVLIDAESETLNARRRASLFGIDETSSVSLFDFGGWTSAGHNIAQCAWAARGTVVIQQGGPSVRGLDWPGITHAVVTPHILSTLLAAPDLARREGLRLIVISGALSRPAFEQARARLTSEIYTNLGSTETGPFTITRIADPEDLRWHTLFPGREAEVVDEDDRPLPPGALGLMRVRIIDNVTGYQDDPETTKTFFRDGWFYPGDLAQFRADGRVGLFGRVTDIINVNGSKHPTGPIEAQLQDQLGIEGVCVFSTQNPGAEEELHVAIETAEPLATDLLTQALSSALRGFQKAHVHYVSKLPRTSTGKVQRFALKQLLATGEGPN